MYKRNARQEQEREMKKNKTKGKKSVPNTVRIMRMQWTVKYRPIISGRRRTPRAQ